MMTTRELLHRARVNAERVTNVIRRVIGVPDYDRYLEHQRTHHPECTPLSREEFMWQRMNDRYSRPGARCC
jgi:uncharacterized short protein YbdD (DUF466 family)